MSLSGLFRTLLHDVFLECPELIEETMADFSQRTRVGEIRDWVSMLRDGDIRIAFSRLINSQGLHSRYRLCLFIDGLDEYEEIDQDDAKGLVDLLYSWTKIAPESIKLCVSSREYNVFMNALSPNYRIRYHQFTRSDMTRFVLDNLKHVEPLEEREKLTLSIVENGEGVFLRVALVVRRIRELIENKNDFASLQAEINSLPSDLDALSQRILGSLPPFDLRQAYQTFSIYPVAKRRHRAMSDEP